MNKNILLSAVIVLVLASCQKGTSNIPATETPDIIETMVATLMVGATPTIMEGTPVSTPKPVSDHLVKLKEGMDAWNTWRSEHPGIKPNLLGVDIQGLNLSKYNLFKANLAFANLSGASLVETRLQAAILRNAKLNNANLSQAFLNNANLMGADLTNADLTGAVLTNARYDNITLWPAGFDPVAAGAILVAQ